MSQRLLMERIKAISFRIFDYKRRFNLPKDDPDHFNTHGGALALQKMKRDRSVLQADLDPIRLVATGVSCRDCIRFEHDDKDRLVCHRWGHLDYPTSVARLHDDICGPAARAFVHA